ncbi:dual specificity phosphatase [Lophiostoma macrostomum CBS 122681]|uniref:Dual specificity phosphatase n=1 Tax=Lophiostoma macrostomum CBS 122681 TaxID=1314788 RepID=A0A6A6TDA9_9PLEO|nr:dual specificity phosphatase [Lophiostoma macrostomum CBS 122681]
MPNPHITKIADRLYLGDGKSSRDAQILSENKITAVVSLSGGRWIHWSQPWYKKIIVEGNHLFIKCEDSMTQDLLPELAAICAFIKRHLASGSVLVHCDQGISRSVTAMIAYLMQTYQYDVATALALVGGKRKVKPNDNFKEQLEVWKAVGGNVWTAPGVPKKEYAAFLTKRTKRLKEAGLTGNESVGVTSL